MAPPGVEKWFIYCITDCLFSQVPIPYFIQKKGAADRCRKHLRSDNFQSKTEEKENLNPAG